MRPDEFEDLVGRGHKARYPAGAFLMRQGEPSDCVMVLLHGHVTIHSGDHGLMAVRRRGELLGEFAFFQDGLRTASVRAHDDVTVVKIPGRHFLAYLDANPRIQRDLLRLAIAKLRTAESRRTKASSGAALVRALAQAAEGFAEDPTTGPLLVPLTQAELGGLAGISDLSVVRGMKVLRDQRVVDARARKGSVLIPCLACLRRAALSTQKYGKLPGSINGCGGAGSCPEG
ncbi:Crp/Fnr family transcriptional regulator [Actinosynnema sp. NPDC023587]|uniref:Crp/Fnr family transcriptional regulator n=1 Tax=Actinosynnema sp. NPDC023587 TaxID=3154695 RepID=UPI0033D0F9B7